jgi:PAS domain-containing protein
LEAAKAGEIGKFVGFCPTTDGNPEVVGRTGHPHARHAGLFPTPPGNFPRYHRLQTGPGIARASEERLESVIRGSNDGFWDGHVLPDQPWHSPMTPVWWSPRVREMLGYNEQEFPDILDSWASRLHPDDREIVFDRLHGLPRKRAASHYDVDYRLLTKQGDYCWFHARAEVLERDAQGMRSAWPARCNASRSASRQKPPRLSEERLRMALTESEVGIWDWDVQSDRLYWSPDVEALFGLTPGSFPGTYAAYIGLIYALDRGSVLMPHRTQFARPGHLHQHPASRRLAGSARSIGWPGPDVSTSGRRRGRHTRARYRSRRRRDTADDVDVGHSAIAHVSPAGFDEDIDCDVPMSTGQSGTTFRRWGLSREP